MSIISKYVIQLAFCLFSFLRRLVSEFIKQLLAELQHEVASEDSDRDQEQKFWVGHEGRFGA